MLEHLFSTFCGKCIANSINGDMYPRVNTNQVPSTSKSSSNQFRHIKSQFWSLQLPRSAKITNICFPLLCWALKTLSCDFHRIAFYPNWKLAWSRTLNLFERSNDILKRGREKVGMHVLIFVCSYKGCRGRCQCQWNRPCMQVTYVCDVLWYEAMDSMNILRCAAKG